MIHKRKECKSNYKLKRLKESVYQTRIRATPTQRLYTKWIRTHEQIESNEYGSYEQCTTRFFKEKTKKQNFTTYIWPKCLTSNGNSGESGWSPLTRATNLSTHSALNNLNFHVTEFIVLCRLVSYVEFFSLIFSDKHGLPLDSVTWINIHVCLYTWENIRKTDKRESKGPRIKQALYHLKYVGDRAAWVKQEIWSRRSICWQRTQPPEVFIAYEKLSTRYK